MWRFEALIHTVAFTLAEMNAGTHGKSLVDVEADALIDTMADNLQSGTKVVDTLV